MPIEVSDEEMLAGASAIVVGTISRIIDPSAKTFGNPPRLSVSVLQVIKGSKIPATIDVVWNPPRVYIQTKPHEEWKQQILLPPPVRTKWILIFFGDRWDVRERTRLEYSEARHQWVVDTLERGERQLAAIEAENQARVEADIALQNSVNVKSLYTASSDVILGFRSSEHISPYTTMLTIKIDRRVMDSSPKPSSAPYAYIRVDQTASAATGNRLRNVHGHNAKFAFFLKAVPEHEWKTWRAPMAQTANIDPRRYVLVGGVDGILFLNDRVRRALGSVEKSP
jgi:hypothetical protein